MTTRIVFIATSLAIGALAGGGCFEDLSRGERSQGGCPDDETCSDLAPNGLRFVSAPDGEVESFLETTATGGEQTFIVMRIGNDGSEAPLDVEFAATTCPAGRSRCEPDAIVTRVDPPEVTFAPLADGCPTDNYLCLTTLRIVEPGTDRLLDRTTPGIAAVDEIELRDAHEYLSGPMSMLAGSKASFDIGLRGPWGPEGGAHGLVDEAMTVEVVGDADLERTRWDRVDLFAADPQELQLEVRAGTAEATFELPVVAEVASITAPVEPIELRIDQTREVCFQARDDEDRRIIGAEWSAAANGPVSVTESDQLDPGCFTLRGERGEGDPSIQITVGGKSAQYDIELTVASADSTCCLRRES